MSMPLSKEDEINNEEEGMIGKLLNVARKNHDQIQSRIDEN